MTMTITYVIPGARTLDQLNEPTFDGHSDENASDNCVATTIAEGLNILDAGGAVKFVGDELHDAVYGQGYIGFQAASRYVGYCADAGVALTPFNGSQAALIATIHEQVAAGHPVVVTMPSQWSVAPSDPVHPAGSTHVGLAVGVGPGAIRVMNPWHGFMQDASDDWWAARLCEGQVWVMQKKAGATVANIAGTAGSATPYYGLVYTTDAQEWHCPSTGHNVGRGFLALYQGLRGPQSQGQSATELLGLPLSDEYQTADGKTRQDFERGSLIYDASASNPWRFYCIAIAHEVAALRDQVSAATSALATAKQQSLLDAQTIAGQQQRIGELEAQVAQLTAATATPPAPAPAASPDEIARAAGEAFAVAFTAALSALVRSALPN